MTETETLNARVAELEATIAAVVRDLADETNELALSQARARLESIPQAAVTLRDQVERLGASARRARHLRIAAMADVDKRNGAIAALERYERIQLLGTAPDPIALVVEAPDPDAWLADAPHHVRDRIEATISALPDRVLLGPMPPLEPLFEITMAQALRLEALGLGLVATHRGVLVYGRTYGQPHTPPMQVVDRRTLDVMLEFDPELRGLVDSGRVCRALSDEENISHQCTIWFQQTGARTKLPRKPRKLPADATHRTTKAKGRE